MVYKCFHIHDLGQDPNMGPGPHRAHTAIQPTALTGQDSNPAPTMSALGDHSQRAACFQNQALLLSQRLRMFEEWGYVFLQGGDYNLSTETHFLDPNIYFCPKRPIRYLQIIPGEALPWSSHI